MLVPEGYALFKTLEATLRASVAVAHPFASGMTTRRLLVEREDLMDTCWSEFFRKCSSLSLISPAGSVFRVQSEVGRRGRDGDAQPYWVFLDPLVWVVETRKVAERRKNKFSHFQSIIEGKEDGEVDDEFGRLLSLDEVSESSYKGFAAQLEKYEGWSIACKDADRPKDVEYFDCLSSLVGRRPSPEEHDQTARRGAPRKKRDSVVNALKLFYPDGLVSESQKVAFNKVLSTGVKIDMRTFRRALAEMAEKKSAE
jgi:hypothetical protein